MVCDTPYLENEFVDPRFFLRYYSNLIILLPAVKVSKKSVRRTSLGANVLKEHAPSREFESFRAR